jgi:hypothetical protein
LTSSTWFKIGFTGTGIAVVAALAPVVMAVLGHPKFSEHLGVILNEKSLSILLILFSAVIFRAVMKKREESFLAYLEKQDGEKH